MKTFITLWAVAMLSWLFCFSPIARAENPIVIEYPNGYNLEVPEGWEIDVRPKGFNNAPYSKENPAGKLPGWQGWPWYSLYLQSLNCYPGDLVTSPSVCPPQPRFVRPDTQCYQEPVPVPTEQEVRCLVISPGGDLECEDDE